MGFKNGASGPKQRKNETPEMGPTFGALEKIETKIAQNQEILCSQQDKPCPSFTWSLNPVKEAGSTQKHHGNS